jgi:hypothetical protein
MPQNRLYRQKVLDRISSPEQLNSYIKVSNPRAWLVLVAILVLLGAGSYWILTGTLEISEKSTAVTIDGTSYSWLPSSEVSDLQPNMQVRIGDAQGTVSEISTDLSSYDDILKMIGARAMSQTGIMDGDRLYQVTMTVNGAQDGVGTALIIKEVVNPISFLLK